LGYDFEIVYKKGKQNVVAYALSRKDDDVEASLCAISIIQPDWIIEASDEWKNDEKVWTLIQRLQQDSSASDTFTWKNDSLWYTYCLYLCKNSQLKQKVLLELQTSPVGGHSGFLKTYHRVKKDFFGMDLKPMFKGLWQNVWFANKIRWKQLRPQVFYNIIHPKSALGGGFHGFHHRVTKV
jgi:hypothetical protein